ncbi:MAG: ATP-binding cassette domain-containing protein, partial [Alphaproteobacteria bacterium]|nr:ATP-binding cassette domain-containing protein [Alphaproteobacteria bacterium]
MTIGALVAANMLTGRLLGPLNQLVGSWRAFAAFRQAVARLGAVLAEPAEPAEPAILHGRPTGRLALDGVTFAHAADRPPAIEAVSAEMAAGGITAILGRNGSGKTTMVRLLLGLYRPQAGRVLLDGADLRQFTRRELAGWIGHVPQET